MAISNNFNVSRRNLLLGTATSVVLGAMARTGYAQSYSDASVRTSMFAANAPTLAQLSIRVNGIRRDLAVDTRTTLLDCLRENLHLTGTKKGCAHGQCGACTVLVNGRRVNSCLSCAIMHAGDEITTIEGIGRPDKMHPLQKAFVEHDAYQCGYCTSGQIMSGV